MRRILRYTLGIIAIGLLLCGATSCTHKRTPKPKFQVIAIENIKGSLGKKWSITLTIANNTARDLHLTDGSADIAYNGRKVARIALDDEVVVARRQCSKVEVPLRITLANPLSALSVLNKIRKGDYKGITADYSISIGTLTSHRTLAQSGVTIEAIVERFNYKLK